MGFEEVPGWWVTASLSDISSKLVDGSHNPPAKQPQGMPMLSAVNINDNRITFSDYRLISDEAFQLEDRRTRISPNDVLLTIVGAIGRAAVVTEKTPKFTLQRSVAVIAPIFVDPKFLMYQLGSPRVSLHFKRNARGTAQKGVYLKTLGETPIFLPPLPEQERIVTKIEELLSELDKGLENLVTARAKLEIYRQALLKHAFEGKLSAQWRAENTDKLETADALSKRIEMERAGCYQQQLADWESNGKQRSKPKAPKMLPPLTDEELAELPQLPVGWFGARLGLMTCSVEYGTAAKSSETGNCPVLRMGNIKNARFDWADLVYTDDQAEISKYMLRKGDVLFNRTNSPELVGKTAHFDADRAAVFAGYLIRINQIPTIADGRYVNYFLNSCIARQHGNKVKTDGVNQTNINGDKLINYPFPFCSLDEQKVIVDLLDTCLSEVDQIDQILTIALLQAETLRQTILQKAFSGQLVPQNSNDEAALALLERIKATKVIQSLGKKARK